MADKFDIAKFTSDAESPLQYERQLRRLRGAHKDTKQIEETVDGTIRNLAGGARSFVIYGEPQSGKTEMMICLTAKLLDEGRQFVLHLLNDSVDLLGQNLTRFKSSGLAPGARNFSEILDPVVQIKGRKHVVFCKKNGSDLRKLLEKIGNVHDIVVIDDEADYASPNSKINTGQVTPINRLINDVLGATGAYIGVTATPARLDLNNTFANDNELWVLFPPHSKYTGQNVFFPLTGPVAYRRTLLPDQGSDPKYAREALFRFLVTVAHLNLSSHPDEEKNYSFLVHTSGKKADHRTDWSTIHAALDALVKRDAGQFARFTEQVWQIAKKNYPADDADKVTRYVVDNVGRNSIVVLNSERDWKDNSLAATKPTSLFTIIIGGNIVSRGVTLENLLAMFFTRDVKHKIQQDTYIQRARMFGSRGDYLEHFELTIPNALYLDWHRCFVFHRLSLTAIRDRLGSPVWLGDNRIAAVSSASIDRSTVDLNRGEMSFPIFKFTEAMDQICAKKSANQGKMASLAKLVGESGFPGYLQKYIRSTLPRGDASIAVHKSSDISGYSGDPDANVNRIARKKGFFGKSQREVARFPGAIHHLKIFRNRDGNARLFYKFQGSIQFLKNEKR